MSTVPDYTFYTDVWGGKLKEEDFSSELPRSASFVNYLIGYNEVKTPRQQEAYKKAICASMDAFHTYGYDEGGSFRVGDFTSPANSKSGKQIAYEDANLYLAMSGLLWGGIK